MIKINSEPAVKKGAEYIADIGLQPLESVSWHLRTFCTFLKDMSYSKKSMTPLERDCMQVTLQSLTVLPHWALFLGQFSTRHKPDSSNANPIRPTWRNARLVQRLDACCDAWSRNIRMRAALLVQSRLACAQGGLPQDKGRHCRSRPGVQTSSLLHLCYLCLSTTARLEIETIY